MPRPRIQSPIEILNQTIEGLKTASVRPGLSGYIPQEYQKKFHLSKKKGRLFMGGNRVGKTVSATADACMILTGQHPVWTPIFGKSFIRGRAVGVDFTQGIEQILIPEYKRWIPKTFLIDGSWEKSYNRGLRLLTLNNGSTLEFMSYDQDTDKFAGTSRHFVHMDEEPPEPIFDECMARLLDTNGIWFISMTPLIEQSWTEDRLYGPGTEADHPYLDVFEVPTSENAYIRIEAVDGLYFGMSDEARAARLAGEYQTYKHAVYKEFITEQTYIDPIVNTERWEVFKGPGYTHFMGLDHGLRNPTACLFGCVDSRENIIIYKEYYVAGQLVADHARSIKKIIADLGVKISYGVIDPSTQNRSPLTGDTIQSVYSEHGLYFAPANNDLDAGIDRVTNRLKHNLLHITRDCVKTRWEFNRYRWGKYVSQKTIQSNNLKEKPVAKDDHAMDALRYLLVSRPALYNEVDTTKGSVFNVPTAVSVEDFMDQDVNRVKPLVPLDDTLGNYY